ncbi:MAG: NAD(+) synthase [Bacteroidales bacterium]|nr:NAD(+) synthase [Bacteroidales bacterium]
MTNTEYMDNFDAIKVKNDIVTWIRNWFKENGDGCNAVIGISGGKDSSVVAALCVEALGKDRVIGILMPNHEQSDIGDAYRLVDHLDIMHTVINVGHAIDNLSSHISSRILCRNKRDAEEISVSMSDQAKINLPPRIRMATLYAFSQSLNGRVANTCNLSEDFIGYSTRWGDAVGDFSPLGSLTTDMVVAVGKACGLPDDLVEKVPADGLCGKTDEENFGFSYDALNRYIHTGSSGSEETDRRIQVLHERNLFKLSMPPAYPDDWIVS